MGPFMKVLMTSSLIRMKPSITSLRCYVPDVIDTMTDDITSSVEIMNLSSSTANNNLILSGHIYFVATPIGNLLDISERAKRILSDADYICAEDTRHTRQLLNLLKIKPKKLFSHHEHNYLEQIPKIIELAKSGHSIAVVSDAGTPGISDPGAQLAQECFKQNIPLHPIPGPSAVVAALSVCGFPSSEFSFFGFVDVKGKERAAKLTRIANYQHTAVFFEAPHRIVSTLTDLVETYGQGDRECVYCREVTKLHEEIVRAPLHVCLSTMKQRDESEDKNNPTRIRGEFTLILGPVDASLISKGGDNGESEKILSKLRALKADSVSRSEAVKLVTEITGVSKSIVYKLALDEPWPNRK